MTHPTDLAQLCPGPGRLAIATSATASWGAIDFQLSATGGQATQPTRCASSAPCVSVSSYSLCSISLQARLRQLQNDEDAKRAAVSTPFCHSLDRLVVPHRARRQNSTASSHSSCVICSKWKICQDRPCSSRREPKQHICVTVSTLCGALPRGAGGCITRCAQPVTDKALIAAHTHVVPPLQLARARLNTSNPSNIKIGAANSAFPRNSLSRLAMAEEGAAPAC